MTSTEQRTVGGPRQGLRDGARPARGWGSRLGDVLLTLASIGGVVCILAVLAALLFKVSLIMFSTGSMAPTIPTGSVAVVRQIPAAEVAIGDARVSLALSGFVVGLLALLTTAPTLAIWQDREFGGHTFTAGTTMTPPVGLTCSAGFLLPATFTWTPPTAGSAVAGYAWTLTAPGGVVQSNTQGPTKLSKTFSGSGLSVFTTYTFAVRTVGPSPWIPSSALSGRATFLSIVLGLNTNCSVP